LSRSAILLSSFQQWGYKSSVNEGDISYPITSKAASVTLATATSHSGHAVAVTTSDCNQSGFSFLMENTSNLRWIALCW
jgi:hypothetical protein